MVPRRIGFVGFDGVTACHLVGERAITTLQKLLSMPYMNALLGTPLTPALLPLDSMFDPLRGDPRFQKLCQEETK